MTKPLSSRLTGISGGIGSGKSVIARILRIKGFPVFDCDLEAQYIMDCDENIHRQLCEHIHSKAVREGKVDRRLISSIVFNDKSRLAKLNGIVHNAVFERLARWVKNHDDHRIFVESAIMVSSGLIELVAEEWYVTAPTDLRINRVIKRSGLDRTQVMARIASQAEEERAVAGITRRIIHNDNEHPLLPQINQLISQKCQ